MTLLTVIEALQHFGIVITASIVGSLIFASIFFMTFKRLILSSMHKIISKEVKQQAAEWLEDVVKNGISKGLKDEKVNKVVCEVIELIEERIKKEKK